MSKEKLKVLIVEDSEDDLALLLRELNKGNYEIEYELAEDAKGYKSALKKKWDIIISDYSLPNFNGFEALKICNEKGVDIPFIIVSGTVGEDLAVEMMKAGAKDYIMKKSLKLLLPAVQREIEDAKIRQKNKLIAKEKEVLFEINQEILNTNSLDELLKLIYKNIKKVIYAENCFISMYNANTDEISFPLFVDKFDNPPQPRKKGKGFTEYVLRTGVPLLIDPDNIKEIAEKNKLETKGTVPVSWLGVPLISHTKPIGVIVVASYEKDILYTEAEKGFLSGIANQIALAIEKKQAEEELREKEGFLSSIVENIPNMLFIKDAKELRFIRFNKAGEKLLGYKSDELIGKNDYDFFPREQADFFTKKDMDVLKSGKQYDIPEEPIDTKAGKKILHTIKLPILDKDGKPAFLLGISEDITERKAAEDALRESEYRFKILAEVAPVGIFRADEQGVTNYVNPRWCEISKMKYEDAMGFGWLNAVHPEDKILLSNVWKQVVLNKSTSIVEYRFVHPDGSIAWVIGRAVPQKDKNGKVIGYIGTITDITERKMGEEALKESEERYRVFINSTNDMAFLKDNDFKYLLVNKSNAEFFRKDEKDIIGKTDFDLMPKTAAEKCNKTDREALKSESVVINEEKVGDRIYETHKFKVPLSNNKIGVGGYVRDITIQKWAEENLRKSEEHYRTLLTAIPDLMFRLDKEGRFIDYHADNNSILFTPPEKFLGKYYKEILPPEISNKFKRAIEEARKTGDIVKFEYEFHMPGNDKCYYEARITYYSGESIAIIRDVTEQKKAEEALIESENKYRSIFENVQDVFYRLDVNGIITEISPSVGRYIDLTREEIIGRSADIFYAIPEEREAFLKEIFENGKVSDYELLINIKEGEARYASVNAHLLFDSKSNPVGIEGALRDITERKKSEKKLIESEERYRVLIESMSEGVLRGDENDAIMFANKSACEIFGYKPEELMGKIGYEILIIEEDRHIITEKNKLRTKSVSDTYEVRGCKKNGEIIWLSVNGAPIKDEKGNVIGSVGIFSDITQRKKSEEALKASQERYRILIETMNEGVILVDNKDEIQFINKRACEIYGYEPEELIGKIGYKVIVAEEDRHIILEKNATRLNAVSDSYEIRGLKKNGEVIWLNINGAPVKDKNGNIVGSVGIMIDITERKHAEEELKKLSRAVEQSPASIVITDIKGNIEYVNPKFVSLTGYLPEEVIGKNPRVLKSGETPDVEYGKLWDTISTGKDWIGEFHNKKKNGELYWESAIISPVKNSNGQITHFLAIKEDITEKKQKEIELINAKEKAEESERLKSSFLANMSHELRTPMVGILGFAELMKDMANDSELKDFADNITKSGKRLLETLNLILDLSRIEAGKLDIKASEVDIIQLTKEVYENYIIEAEKKNLRIRFTSSEERIVCKIDERMLWESINNLINNAIKYTKAGEIIVEVNTDEKKKSALIKFIDTGIGIPKESLNTIFEEFRQVSEGYSRGFEGTGLGLTITKNFIEKNGGKISVESEFGIGSVFTIELPILKINVDEKPSKTFEKEITDKKPLTKKKDIHLLCVDDDSFTREYLEYILRDFYRISFANNGFTAIEMAKSNKFSMILMDINLGKGIDGIETTRKIFKLPGYENIPVIAMTAFAMKGDKEEFLNSGMREYISKPFKSGELLKLIEEVINNLNL